VWKREKLFLLYLLFYCLHFFSKYIFCRGSLAVFEGLPSKEKSCHTDGREDKRIPGIGVRICFFLLLLLEVGDSRFAVDRRGRPIKLGMWGGVLTFRRVGNLKRLGGGFLWRISMKMNVIWVSSRRVRVRVQERSSIARVCTNYVWWGGPWELGKLIWLFFFLIYCSVKLESVEWEAST